MAARAFVIGYKNHALRILKHLIKSEFCSEISVFHPEASKLIEVEKIDGSVSTTSDFGDASECSCVFICSPSNTHLYYLKELLDLASERGHLPFVYCEKPIAVTKDELDWLESNLGQFKSRIQVGFNFLYSDFFLAASRFVENQKIGKPISAFFEISHGLAAKKEYASSWRAQDSSPFSKLLGNVGIHYIHACLRLFGRIHSFSLAEQSIFKTKNPDSVSLLLHHVTGVQSHIFCSYATIFSKRFSIYFTNGQLQHSNEGLALVSPRDTFSKDGQFASPPRVILNSNRVDEDDSLGNAIDSFLANVVDEKELSQLHVKSALEASEAVIEIASNNPITAVRSNIFKSQ